MNLYQQRALEGASNVEQTVALYDGIIRFLREAVTSVERNDEHARRIAVKRALDILIHLQGTLQMDVGGKPAEALSEFYAAMFALMLQGSMYDSKQKFEDAIACVRPVRDAWRQIATGNSLSPAETRDTIPEAAQHMPLYAEPEHQLTSSWTA